MSRIRADHFWLCVFVCFSGYWYLRSVFAIFVRLGGYRNRACRLCYYAWHLVAVFFPGGFGDDLWWFSTSVDDINLVRCERNLSISCGQVVY